MIRAAERRFLRLTEVAARLGCDWPRIRRAIVQTHHEMADLQTLLSLNDRTAPAKNTSLVFFAPWMKAALT
jgi:hypothetical protein